VWRHKFAAAAAAKAGELSAGPIDASDLGTGGEQGGLPPAPTKLLAKAPPAAKLGAIEIELSGARVRVEPGADATTLCTVLSALRGGR
jgi:transposase